MAVLQVATPADDTTSEIINSTEEPTGITGQPDPTNVTPTTGSTTTKDPCGQATSHFSFSWTSCLVYALVSSSFIIYRF